MLRHSDTDGWRTAEMTQRETRHDILLTRKLITLYDVTYVSLGFAECALVTICAVALESLSGL